MADYLSVLESLGGGNKKEEKMKNGAKNGEDNSTTDSRGTIHDAFDSLFIYFLIEELDKIALNWSK